MLNYPKLIFKNILRNKRRTVLTALSITLALFVLATLTGFVTEIEAMLDESSPLRLISRHAISLANVLPERYGPQIQRIPGVAGVCALSWFGGTYIEPAKTDFAQFACDAETLFDVYTEIAIPEDQQAAFIKDRAGAIVGRGKALKHGWKIGDRITLKGVIYPVDLELTVRGIYTGTVNQEAGIYFQRRYLEEALGRPGVAGSYWILADSPESVPRVIEAVDDTFRNSDAPTKTETERAFSMNFVSMLGNLKGLVITICSVIIFTILLVSGNTMAMSVRERVREIAVMKSLGFRRGRLMLLVMAEGALISLLGGLLGVAGARLLFGSLDLASFSQGFFQKLNIGGEIIAVGLAVSALVGLLSAGIPAWLATRKTVVDGLRHVG